MKIIKRIVPIFLCVAIVLSLCGCTLPFMNKKDSEAEPTEKPVKIDTNFNASTKVSYSSGSDSNWAYGNQRKEFPQNEACYVRISSTVIAEKNKGVGSEITITYKFTGAQNCNIELSDGIATQVDSGDPNVIVFTRTINAEKEKKATESIVVFQYMPNSDATSITLEVSYDEHVPAQYDVRNTIYFSKDAA
ncbi:MAG: hypothetical protein K6G66_06335 [Oscillospiraceae bacterium]|nr:hypothetical protein [Oscillospiraceae bacterium]